MQRHLRALSPANYWCRSDFPASLNFTTSAPISGNAGRAVGFPLRQHGRSSRLEEIFAVKALDAFGDYGRAELAACGGIVSYVELTQKGKLPRLQPPRRMSGGEAMEIDAATRRNLELVRTMNGAREGSLLSVIDRTVTGAGGRLLTARLSAPLTDAATISARHDAVAWFAESLRMRDDVRDRLRAAPDMERALTRLTIGRGGPRDLGAIRDGLDGGR